MSIPHPIAALILVVSGAMLAWLPRLRKSGEPMFKTVKEASTIRISGYVILGGGLILLTVHFLGR